ncbi:MAG: CpaD family pilus assembly lipoprotein [Rhizobiaceae bacterium]|nr:CpaD family pilus assembly lipoprotein [Rhizobiaceae bacterium]
MSRVTKFKKPSLSRGLPVILTALIVSGCGSYSKDHFTVGSVPSDYRTKHPIVVAQNEDVADMIVTRDMKGMSLRQRNVALAMIGRYKRSGAKIMRIILPAGSHNEAAARRVGTDLVQLMKDERVPPSHIQVSRYHASNHGDSATIRLSFVTVDAKVHSKCGQWHENLYDDRENRNYGNFGCATQNNLAEMIANPEDLVSPRGESEIDATRRDNVINDWRSSGTPDLPSLL